MGRRITRVATGAAFDHLRVESMGRQEPRAAEPRLGRRTALSFPLLPPPQKNRSALSDSSPDTPVPVLLVAARPICSARPRKMRHR